jgi:proline iminopeptidase
MLNCKALAESGYRVVFYDQRGSGLSERLSKSSFTAPGIQTLDIIYDELSGVIAHYRTSPAQRVYLIGHSWGGIMATGYAGRHPNEIQGLVVAEPGGFKWDDIRDYVKESISFNLWGEELNNVTYIDQFMTGKEDQHEILDYKMAMRASNNDIVGEDNTEPGSFWRLGATINAALFELGENYSPDFSAGIKSFNVPVLFIYSEKNKAYTDSWAQKISGAFNTVDVFRVQGVGHGGIFFNSGAWNNHTMPKILSYFDSI